MFSRFFIERPVLSNTLAFLIIIHVTLIGARDFTRGSQTFYGVPRLTTVYVAFVAAALFILIARILKETPLGLKLRAAEMLPWWQPSLHDAATLYTDLRKALAVVVQLQRPELAGRIYSSV